MPVTVSGRGHAFPQTRLGLGPRRPQYSTGKLVHVAAQIGGADESPTGNAHRGKFAALEQPVQGGGRNVPKKVLGVTDRYQEAGRSEALSG